MPEVSIIVQPSVGWKEEVCQACGKQRSEYVEIHLKHSATKILICSECDEAQLGKPRMVRTTEKR